MLQYNGVVKGKTKSETRGGFAQRAVCFYFRVFAFEIVAVVDASFAVDRDTG